MSLEDGKDKVVDGDGIFDKGEIIGFFNSGKLEGITDFCDLACSECDCVTHYLQIKNGNTMKIICSKCSNEEIVMISAIDG